MRGYSVKPLQKGVCFTFGVYWVILVLWQNVGSALLRGTADTLLKLILLIFLTVRFFAKGSLVRKNSFLIICFFGISQLLSFLLNDSSALNFGIIISYVFPFLFILLTYGIGGEFFIHEEELEVLNRIVRLVCIYAIAYIVVFEPSQFIAAFTSKTGYGSELHSFFTSMYEFALYLFYAMVTCVMKIHKLRYESIRKRIPYYVMMFLFFGVQILTFSRTAILGTIAFLLIYTIFFLQSKESRVFLFVACTILAIIILYAPLRVYLFETVFKSGISNSRKKLMPLALSYFSEGDLLQKLFGHGISTTRAYFFTELDYASVHNGYLQVLIYYGIVGEVFLILFLCSQCIAALRIIKMDKYIGVLSLAMLSFAVLTMFPSTLVVFNSSIDCFFLTTMLIILPKYMRNAVYNRCFYSNNT